MISARLRTALAALALALAATSSYAQSQTALFLEADRYADPGLPFRLTVDPLSREAVQNVEVALTLPAGVTYASGPDFCAAAGDRVLCTMAMLPANPKLVHPFRELGTAFTVQLNAPDNLAGGTLTISGELHGAGAIASARTADVTLYRTFLVSQTGDSGAGSLREAIALANANCSSGPPCKVGFAIAGGLADGVAAIAPMSPLPAIELPVLAIDGTIQTRRMGDSNADGPEIELRGNGAGSSSGLTFTKTCDSIVRGLAIGGFPESGIELAGSADCGRVLFNPREAVIEDNYLGIDAHGREARPNLRGVTALAPAIVRHNVVSGNRRTGIWMDTFGIVQNNIVGLDPALRRDLGNGASGVYFGPNVPFADAPDNYIAFNHDFGVAVANGHAGANGGNAVSIQSSIFANWQLPIDLGLDGENGSAARFVAAPTILSAHYDTASDTTTFDILAPAGGFAPIVTVYANDRQRADGAGEAQRFVASHQGFERPRYTIAVKGDWSGKYAAATTTFVNAYGFLTTRPETIINGALETTTSELSRGVLITR